MKASRIAGATLVAGLCLAAATAVAALVSGDFDDTHWRVIAATILAPLLRRMRAAPAAAAPDASGRREPAPQLTAAGLADELAAMAGRLEAAATPADVRREAASLRRLADRAGSIE